MRAGEVLVDQRAYNLEVAGDQGVEEGRVLGGVGQEVGVAAAGRAGHGYKGRPFPGPPSP